MGQARELAQRYYDLFAAGDLDAASDLFADGCVTVTPAGSFETEEHAEFGRTFKKALPDARMELVRVVESGDEACVLARFRGHHIGDLVTPQATIPASGNTIDVRFADYFRVADGRIAAHEVFWDQLDMMAQLGAGMPQ